jgi:hypothetical protein
LFRRLGVLTLPTVHFYDGTIRTTNVVDDDHDDDDYASNLIENFPCPPAKVALLKKKLARFLNERVDPTTLRLLPPPPPSRRQQQQPQQPSSEEGPYGEVRTDDHDDNDKNNVDDMRHQDGALAPAYAGATAAAAATTPADDGVSVDEPVKKRSIVIDNELITEEHLQYLRYGMPFFKDLTDDEFDDMIQKANLLTFNIGDVICKQGMPGTTFYVLKRGVVEMSIKSRFEDPIRTPPNYLGVVVGELRRGDYFGERALSTGEPLAASFRVVEKVRVFAFPGDIIPESSVLHKNRRATQEMVDQLNQRYVLPDDYVPPSYPYASHDADSKILDLLFRFKQIRQAARCFSYIMQTEPKWNDPGTYRRRRSPTNKHRRIV